MTADSAIALAVITPFAAAALVSVAGHVIPRVFADVFAIAAVAGTGALCVVVANASGEALVVHWAGGWQPRNGAAIGIDLAADRVGAGLATLVSVLALASMVFAVRYFEEVRTLFHALLLVFTGAMVGFALTGDLFNLFVLFELMSVAAYGLTAYKSDEGGPLQGALNFAVTNSVGAFLVLFGIALLYGRTGTLNLATMGRALASSPPDRLVIVAFVLLSCGFLVKAAAVPFHFWLADAHAVAPTPVCVLFSGVMVLLGVYGFARVYWEVFAGTIEPSAAMRGVVIALGCITAIVGAVMCFMQQHLKRLLALSTVSHVGIVLVGVGLFDPSGVAAASVYAAGHGAVKAALFVCVGIVLHRKGSLAVDELHGHGRDMVGTAALWIVGGLALAGLPPFGTFLGKGLLDEALRPHHLTALGGVLLVTSALTGAAVLRAGVSVFFGWGRPRGDATSQRHGRDEAQETRPTSDRTPVVMVVPAITLLGIAVLVGVVPRVASAAHEAAIRFTDHVGYAAAVLDSAPLPQLASAASPSLSLSMVVFGVIAAVTAAGLASLDIWSDRLPSGLRAAAHRFGGAPVHALRAVHTGHIGDYIAWVTFGTAALGGAFAIAITH